MQSRTLRYLCAASVVTAMAIPLVASASHSWGNYHWGRTSNPFTLKVGNNVTSQWSSAYSSSLSDWTASAEMNLQGVVGGTTPRKCSPTAGRVEVCNDSYGRTGWLGIAQIWASGSHITQGVVKLNDTYFNTTTYNKPEWRNMVTCQEVGHTLGLDHQDEVFDNGNLGTCMDYTDFPLGPPDNQHPNKHDYDMLTSIYGHTDSTGTVINSVPGDAASNAASDWGMMVRSSNAGRTQVFERELGGGHKLITFVIWVQGAPRAN